MLKAYYISLVSYDMESIIEGKFIQKPTYIVRYSPKPIIERL